MAQIAENTVVERFWRVRHSMYMGWRLLLYRVKALIEDPSDLNLVLRGKLLLQTLPVRYNTIIRQHDRLIKR